MDLFKTIFDGVVKPIFEFLEQYGLDAVLVAVIITMTFLLKLLDKSKKRTDRYVWLPFIISAAINAVWTHFELREWLKNTILYGALASAAYNVYSKTFKAKVQAKLATRRKKP